MTSREEHALPALKWVRWSLVFVWLLTAVVSIHQWNGQSSDLLHSAGVPAGSWQDWLIGAGAALDLVIGFWLWLRPSKMAYAMALTGMLVMTLAATALLPALWLHPLGPLSKNLPIAAALLLLMQAHTGKK
ncbi:MAG: epimerase [Comamonadaceae bacterium]|nr:epimerase [Comamonadaceae bacterium]